jgi:hypothetical protein
MSNGDWIKLMAFLAAIFVVGLVAYFIGKTIDIFEAHPCYISFAFGFFSLAIIEGLFYFGRWVKRRYFSRPSV